MKCLAALLLATAALLAQNQTPNIVNARFDTRPFSGDLRSQVNSTVPAWFGYAIKTRPGNGDSRWCNGTRLENSSGGDATPRSQRPIALEGNAESVLLFRAEKNRISKVRIFSMDCALDAGGLPFTWITNVPAPQSVKFLRELIHQNGANDVENGSILALSLEDDPAALDALIDLAKNDPSTHIREQALFWLAQKAGARASATIENAIVNDPDAAVKKHAVFALSQLPRDEAVPKLIEVARTQRDPEVRKQAFFWLGQSKDPRALAFFEQVLGK
jgi:hypothetical protein